MSHDDFFPERRFKFMPMNNAGEPYQHVRNSQLFILHNAIKSVGIKTIEILFFHSILQNSRVVPTFVMGRHFNLEIKQRT